jgi:hypothetical protein
MIKPWGSRAKSSFDCDRMTAMLAEIDELRAVLGDLPESQAEMLQEIKKLRAELTALKNQEPYGFWWESDGTFNIGQEPSMSTKAGPCSGWKITPLFLAPGAQLKDRS